MTLEFLGTGTSQGIPVIGCSCAVCTSAAKEDTRYRSSILIRGEDTETILVDIGPEFRLQALRSGLKQLDAVFLTHPHADHLHGLDDVRPLSVHNPLAVYGNEVTIIELKERFAYIFKETQRGGGKPQILPRISTKTLTIGSIQIQELPVFHGSLAINGWLFTSPAGAIAYISDTSEIPAETLQELKQLPHLDILVLGALRSRPHSTHLNFEGALHYIEELKPHQAYITHICHEHSHQEISTLLEGKAKPAYDGLILRVTH